MYIFLQKSCSQGKYQVRERTQRQEKGPLFRTKNSARGKKVTTYLHIKIINRQILEIVNENRYSRIMKK